MSELARFCDVGLFFFLLGIIESNNGRVSASLAVGGLLFYERHYTLLPLCAQVLRGTMTGQIEGIQACCQIR